jgi:hypothetical protein
MNTRTYASIAVAVWLLSTSSFGSEVTMGPDYFAGCLGSIHNSAGYMQYLFCEDTGTMGSCIARNHEGVIRACHTSNPTHLKVIRGIDDSSCIYARYNLGGRCTLIKVTNSSVAPPKR